MVDILLIQPPIRDFYLTAKRTIPYGLTSIAAPLIRNGFSVELLDALAVSRSRPIALPPEMGHLDPYYGRPDISPFSLFHGYRHYGYSLEHIGNVARETGAFLVGISSLFTPYSDMAIQTAERVKEVLPDCQIVIGGHHPTALPEAVMASPVVDYVIRGEGEESMVRLAEAIRSDRNVGGIPGIVYRRPDGNLAVSDPAIVEDLDTHSPPATELVRHSYYRRGRKGSAVIVASRGCPMKCSYCAVGSSEYQPYRRRSVESVLSEIETAVRRHGCGFIDFEDEHLTLNRSWFLELLDGIVSRFNGSGIELRAMNGLYPPSLDDDMIRSMAEAGFRTLNLSLGSISPEQLRRFGRPQMKEELDAALQSAKAHGLESVVYIIVAAPGQSAADSLQDLLYLFPRDCLVGVSVYYPAPGSKDYGVCRQMGILPQHLSLMRSSALPLSDTTTRVETATLLRLGRMINFMKSLQPEDLDSLDPLPCPEQSKVPVVDRRSTGLQLLRHFLDDGNIRGVTPDGHVYEHIVSKELALGFLDDVRV